jgi:GR25 family glycosyltransferase involved in LPS biosynthesis
MTEFFAITLESTPERTEHARQTFARENVLVKWVYGVDAVEIGIKPAYYMHHHADGIGKYFITPGACALVLSNYMALRMAEMSGCDDFVIFEDDVTLPESFLEKFAEVRAEAIAAGSLATWLEWCCMDTAESEKPAGKLIKFGRPLCTAAVWYRKEAIPHLIKAIHPAQAPVDILIRHRTPDDLKHTFTYPQLCGQATYKGEMASTIHRSMPEDPKECIA